MTHTEAVKYFRYNKITGDLSWRLDKGRAKAGHIVKTVTTKGYLIVGFNGKRYKVHRVAWLLTFKEFPPEQIDHINGVTSDNRLINLRAATNTQNHQHGRVRSDTPTSVKGISWVKARGNWECYIHVGKKINLGQFAEWWDALCARKSAENQYNWFANNRMTDRSHQ